MVLKLSTGKRIWLQCLTGGFLARWEDSGSILSLISLCPQGSFCWKFASISGRTGRMRARLWLSIWQSEREFKGEETAQVGSESAVLHWKIDLCKPQAATACHSTWVVLQCSGNSLQPSSSKLTLLPENYHHHRFLWPSELIFWAVSPASDSLPHNYDGSGYWQQPKNHYWASLLRGEIAP